MRQVTCLIQERQLRLYGQVASFQPSDPMAHTPVPRPSENNGQSRWASRVPRGRARWPANWNGPGARLF